MPIRPENKDKYPANWKELARAVKEEAGWKCEECGHKHGTLYRRYDGHGTPDYVEVVCTVAHLDHDPENCERSNLRCLCARCHNRLDAPVRAANRKRRLLEEAGQLEFAVEREEG